MRSDKEDISFLEKNIFRINENKFDNSADNIETYTAFDIYDEVNFAARKIRSLVVDNGYNYKDIVVITRDISKYNGVLDTALEKYDIPYFMDVPKDIFTQPVIWFVSGLIETAVSNFDRDILLSTLKTGLF